MAGKLKPNWLGGILQTMRRFAERVANRFRRRAPEPMPALEPSPQMPAMELTFMADEPVQPPDSRGALEMEALAEKAASLEAEVPAEAALPLETKTFEEVTVALALETEASLEVTVFPERKSPVEAAEAAAPVEAEASVETATLPEAPAAEETESPAEAFAPLEAKASSEEVTPSLETEACTETEAVFEPETPAEAKISPKASEDATLSAETEASMKTKAPKNTEIHAEAKASPKAEASPEAEAGTEARASAEAETSDESPASQGTSSEEPPAELPPAASSLIAFVADPFGLTTNEVAAAQSNEDEEIEGGLEAALEDIRENIQEGTPEAAAEFGAEGAPTPLDPDRLARLAETIESEASRDEWKAPSSEETDSEEATAAAEQELAAQIAEDQALAAEDAAAAQAAAEEEAQTETSPLLNAEGELDLAEVQSCIEALLFMSDKPLSAARLRELLGPEFSEEIFASGIQRVTERYQEASHGIELVAVAGGYQFRTKPGRANLARKLAKTQVQRLSTGGMETLAIVAYKQPVLKDDIDKIRGVDSSYFIRGLLDRKLIEITGRSDLPGRPMQYATTDQFLELFGLADLAALPPLHELERMIPTSESGNAENEDPQIRQMRKLVTEMKADGSTNLNYDPAEDAKILSEIRERVQAIPTSTPYLEEQKALEKQRALDAAAPPAAPEVLIPTPATEPPPTES